QLSKDEAESRLAAQWPLEKKKDLASHVLNNNGNQDQLLTQVFSLLEGGRQDDRD
ncbi:MAG: dephospho-CoA kinase, partial [Streptococcus mitis]|nr:dephospho-CoA kinase [Streptococcus mitis]